MLPQNLNYKGKIESAPAAYTYKNPLALLFNDASSIIRCEIDFGYYFGNFNV